MITSITIRRATVSDANEIAVMVGELLNEIMTTAVINVFNFNHNETKARLQDYIDREKYFVFVAQSKNVGPVGFITLFEGRALYAEGAFGIIPELYVRPEFRSKNVGLRLVAQAKAFGSSHGWTRLEVTTPPLPQFDKSLTFYVREGFEITGGRKLNVVL